MSVSAVAVYSSPPIPVPSADAPVEQRVDYVVQQAKIYVDERDAEYDEVLASIPVEALPDYLKPVTKTATDVSIRKLPDSGQISLGQIGEEGGKAANAQVSINDAACRDLISKTASTQMSFNEWYGASQEPSLPAPIYSGVTRTAPDGGGAGAWGRTEVYTAPDLWGNAGDLVVVCGACFGQRSNPDGITSTSVGNFHSKIQWDRRNSPDNKIFNSCFAGYDHTGDTVNPTYQAFQNAPPYMGEGARQRVAVFQPPAGVRYKLVLAGVNSGSSTDSFNVPGAVGWVARCYTYGSRPTPRPTLTPSAWTNLGKVEGSGAGGTDDPSSWYEEMSCYLKSGDQITINWPLASAERAVAAIVEQ